MRNNIVSDKRRLRIIRVIVVAGELELAQGAECWQGADGNILGVGLWYDMLVPNGSDLIYQADTMKISPLELLKRKLNDIAYIKVEML